MKKDLRFVKCISLSSKGWIGISSLRSRDVLRSIGREKIDNISLKDKSRLPNHLYTNTRDLQYFH